MKVLWVTNSIFPELAIAMGNKPGVFGGWQFSLAKDLEKKGIQLVIVTAKKEFKDFYYKSESIEYYLMNSVNSKGEYDNSLEIKWINIIDKTKPDLVHIHGSEHAHGLSLVNTFPDLKYVLSIQGLISVYERYYYAGIDMIDILRNLSIRDLIKKDNIISERASFKKRGDEVEKIYFKKINNIIGRTSWDKSHALNLNPNCSYFFCNESLRDSFYDENYWDFKNVDKYSLFLSQGNYPIKGLHQVIKAVAIVKKSFPNVLLKFAGGDILRVKDSKNKFKIKGYGVYLKQLIKNNNVEDNIKYVGVLSEVEMREEYLKSHLFICPSSIENSPNSLGEAQILGVPSIGSYVGGIPDMIEDQKSGLLYRFEEHEMLASKIIELFNNENKLLEISINAKLEARERHNRESNASALINIYDQITTKK